VNVAGANIAGQAERIPLDIELLVTATIKNPYKIHYKAPKNWVEKAMDLIDALVTNWVGTKSYDEIIAIRTNNLSAFWNEIKSDTLFTTFKDEWGWEIEDIRIKSITPPEEIRKAGMMEKEMDMKARADVAKTTGRWLKMMVSQTGLTEAEIQLQIKTDPASFQTKYGAIAQSAWDVIIRELGIAGKAYLDARFQGGHGLEELITLFRRMPTGGATVAEEDKKGEKPKSSKAKEAAEEAHKLREEAEKRR